MCQQPSAGTIPACQHLHWHRQAARPLKPPPSVAAAAGCRGDYNAALAAAVDALPLQTRVSVIAHCRWHADLCELEMRKWVLHCLGHNAASISIRSSYRLARPTLARPCPRSTLRICACFGA